MNLLAIESSQSKLSIAIQNGDSTFEKISTDSKSHAEKIISLTDTVLKKAGLTIKQMDAIAVSQGPGSFTSLRIGYSTAKGFCFGHDLPLITVPTLKAIALSHKTIDDHYLLPIIFSKANFFYHQLFDSSIKAISAPAYLMDTEIIAFLQNQTKKVFLIGERLSSFKLLYPSGLYDDASRFSALQILELAKLKYQANDFTDISDAEPFYLKEFEAKISQKKFFMK